MDILLGIFKISLEQGLAYALVALGIVISFRILAFPDLTVDGSFVLGGAVVARMIVLGYPPLIGITIAILIGFAAGCATGAVSPPEAGIAWAVPPPSVYLVLQPG